MLSSYQEYLINSERARGNWEFEVSNITYEEAKKIAEYEEIKEIACSYNFGIAEERFSSDTLFPVKYNIMGYDANMLKNEHIYVIEGRLPENENEIILSLAKNVGEYYKDFVLGDEIEFTLNGNVKKFKIVR
jgi:beta-lactamase class D